MASITWAHVVDHASALATVDADQQADLLALVNTHLNVAAFGGEDAPKTKLARIYWAAHFASLPGSGTTADGAATSGPVTSESTGGVSRAYASLQSGSTGGENWSETVWGRRFLALLRGSRAAWPRTP